MTAWLESTCIFLAFFSYFKCFKISLKIEISWILNKSVYFVFWPLHGHAMMSMTRKWCLHSALPPVTPGVQFIFFSMLDRDLTLFSLVKELSDTTRFQEITIKRFLSIYLLTFAGKIHGLFKWSMSLEGWTLETYLSSLSVSSLLSKVCFLLIL